MANKRITDRTLEANFKDGRILNAEDLNKIVRFIVEGVNSNKEDLDKVSLGKTNSIVVYNRNKLTPDIGYDGEYGLVFVNEDDTLEREDVLELWLKKDGIWEFESRLSLLDLYLTQKDIFDILEGMNASDNFDIMLGRVSVYTEVGPLSGFRTIDGHTIRVGETVLVAGLPNSADDGIYLVKSEGVWERVSEVKVNQVVSVDYGIEYGGSMQKKLKSNIVTTVKKPERSLWSVFK